MQFEESKLFCGRAFRTDTHTHTVCMRACVCVSDRESVRVCVRECEEQTKLNKRHQGGGEGEGGVKRERDAAAAKKNDFLLGPQVTVAKKYIFLQTIFTKGQACEKTVILAGRNECCGSCRNKLIPIRSE